ncbi:lipopolysaccharide assembly protein LapB [Frankia sp. Cj3]|uniref:tetratricopeptide repeat protein n=1 Tax=Frankia sp. Cj3 TaxID=2880976 RepID=UPI001EF723C2|nr:tetratricopeptide repeat protein [Frankia sp. Cj3]
MRKRRAVTAIVVVTAAAAALLAGAALIPTGVLGGTAARPPAPQASAAGAQDVPTRAIGDLQRHLSLVPGDWPAWAALGTAYVERARATGDPTYYPRAESALARSLAVHPVDNDAALAGQAALAAARHDFVEALRLADAATTINPFGATASGIRADALIELGRYPQAWEAVQHTVDLRPDVASLARVSYAFELRGDTADARDAMLRVLTDATSPTDAAFALFHLGELARDSGDLDGADAAYRRGLEKDPSSTTLLAGRARVAAARGQTESALADYQRVVTRMPAPALVVEYGELLESVGRTEEARTQYALVRTTAELFREQRVDVGVDLALFEADHGDPAAAYAVTAAQLNTRAGIFVQDADAWALHQLGRDSEALAPARAAVALGTRRALLRYHLGVIEAALGQRDAAMTDLRAALATDPYFSPLHAPRARTLLAALAGDR